MDLRTFLIALYVAASYVAWPKLGKALGIKEAGLIAIMVIVIALVVNLLISHQEIPRIKTIPAKALIWILAVCIANGIAIYLQAYKTNDPKIPTWIFLDALFAFEIWLAPFADWLTEGTVISRGQLFGLVLISAGIWFTAKT